MTKTHREPDDLAIGAFSDSPPWSIARSEMIWDRNTAIIRKEQERRLPRLIKKPKFPPLVRAVQVAFTLGTTIGLWYFFERKKKKSRAKLARRIRRAAERLGPTYIKLAQIISAGEGIFPAELVQECKKCRDQVPAVDYPKIEAIVEAELKRPIHEVFSSFEPEPIAAASIAQVHAATLLSGQAVVVKVQRPGIDALVKKDLRVLSWAAPFLIGRIPVASLANPPALVHLFAETIIEELDFRLEASNMLDIAKLFVKLERKEFVIPRPHPTNVTRKLLVMERLHGYSFDDVVGIKETGLNTHDIINTTMLGFLEGAFLHGLFHGDLHGGNLFILRDGKTGLVDFGITGRLSAKERLAFLKMLLSATTNNITGQVEALRDLGALPADTDIQAVIKDLGLDKPLIDPTKLEPEELVKELQTMLKALLAYGARLPKPLMLYVKNLIFIDGAIATLAPELDMFQVVTQVATHFATTHGQTITKQLGMDLDEWELDLDGIKAGLWTDPEEKDSLTYSELKERRELIRKRLGKEI